MNPRLREDQIIDLCVQDHCNIRTVFGSGQQGVRVTHVVVFDLVHGKETNDTSDVLLYNSRGNESLSSELGTISYRSTTLHVMPTFTTFRIGMNLLCSCNHYYGVRCSSNQIVFCYLIVRVLFGDIYDISSRNRISKHFFLPLLQNSHSK